MADDDSGAGRTSLWHRWTSETGPFFWSCAVWPFDDRWETPDGDPPDVRFASGWLRLVLRHAPTLLILLATLSFVGEQLGSYYSPIGTYLPLGAVFTTVRPVYLVGVLVGVLWIAALVRLFLGVGGEPASNLHRSIVFFGTVGVLTLGSLFSVYLVWAEKLTDPRQHLTFRSGYFLFLLVEAHLVYDGLCLRSENLFSKLGRDTFTTEEYGEFRDELRDALGDTVRIPGASVAGRSVGPFELSRSTAFTLLLITPTVPLPVLSIGVPTLPEAVSYTTTVLLQYALVAALFQFAVLIWYFSKLLSSDYLEYHPFHPDERGGFRDLGRFATRVNAILFVGGLYVLYRFYTGGLRVLFGGNLHSMIDFLRWATSFVGPIVLYAAVVIAWLYSSFWRMHRRMKRGREQKLERLQTERREEQDFDDDGVREDVELDWPVYEALQNAPVWPVSRSSLAGIVLIDMIPMLLGTFA